MAVLWLLHRSIDKLSRPFVVTNIFFSDIIYIPRIRIFDTTSVLEIICSVCFRVKSFSRAKLTQYFPSLCYLLLLSGVSQALTPGRLDRQLFGVSSERRWGKQTCSNVVCLLQDVIYSENHNNLWFVLTHVSPRTIWCLEVSFDQLRLDDSVVSMSDSNK